MNKRIAVLLFAWILTPQIVSAEIYRWTDAEGKVHYGDQPPEGVNAEKKEYQSVATPWRKVTMPATRSGTVPPPPPDDYMPSNTPPLPDSPQAVANEPPPPPSDAAGEAEESKARKNTSDRVNADAVKLSEQDKSSKSQKQRVAEIKAKNAAAKAAYNASRSGTSD